MKALLSFELAGYFKKPGFWIVMLLLCGFGMFIGNKLSINPGAQVYKNAPYSIALMTGFLSLMCIFIATPLAVKILFREKDAHFSLILYATPMRKTDYLSSRFFAVFLIGLTAFLWLIIGYAIGQQLDPDRTNYTPFHLWNYLQPVLVLAVPNLLLCTAMVCSIGWLSKNKLLVYVAGLLIYVLYLVVLLFSGSPLMAGSMPPSPEAMDLSAKFDPFGLSAFFQQTNLWTIVQKNSEHVALIGNLLFNRMLYLLFSIGILSVAFARFRFQSTAKIKHQKTRTKKAHAKPIAYQIVRPHTENMRYFMRALLSFTRMDLKFVVKSIPFLLIVIGFVFFIAMEIYTSIDQGIRIPEQYASTGLMANRIVANFQQLFLFVLLFYAHELFWRSQSSRFELIENATPVAAVAPFLAKWLSLSVVIGLFCSLMIAVGIAFQFIFGYIFLEWKVSLSLYYLCGLPLILSAGIILSILSFIKNKWLGLAAAAVVVLLTSTSTGKMIGITSPLLRFQSAFPGRYSDMNGWGNYLAGFSWNIVFGLCVTLLLVLLATLQFGRRRQILGVGILLIGSISTGIYILQNHTQANKQAQLDGQQHYEEQYRKFAAVLQPVITDVKASVDLWPEKNAYRINGIYTIQNKTNQPIEQMLVNFDDDFTLEKVQLQISGQNITIQKPISVIVLKKPMLPGEKAQMQFTISYRWNGFNAHESFNSIVGNGTFIRLSNYFPRFGYQPDIEISDEAERRHRKLGQATTLATLDSPRATNDFINLDLTISTAAGQTAIGVGELTRQWKQNNRNYFRYQTQAPIALRFGISSAKYAVKKEVHNGKSVQVYYDPKHFENVGRLMQNAKLTLDYCRKNFGDYPFRTIRFAEISSFTRGFAATAYPATVFMTEDVVFHTNLSGDKQQDVINELAGHELSHLWWGAHQLAPDEREGSKFLTETLAMYTELMLVKQMHGTKRVLENVRLHRDMYGNQRGFGQEQPLYQTHPDNAHQHYSKGLVTMYQLSEMLGEQTINKALKNMLKKHAYPNLAPVSTDLVNELYAVSPVEMHPKIEDLFKRITTYSVRLDQLQARQNGSGYGIAIRGWVQKFYEDGNGQQTKAAFKDVLELEIEWGDGTKTLQKVPVGENRFDVQFPSTKKPVRVTVDPREKWLRLPGQQEYEF